MFSKRLCTTVEFNITHGKSPCLLLKSLVFPGFATGILQYWCHLISEGLFLLMQLRDDITNNKNIDSSVKIMRDISEMLNMTIIPFVFLRS